ncbi:hypothetical protein [Streptosporangium roseum]|uniref:hypothetical protein n=1 Tax=Streptosporangium roseum TaxID=2001 RepID=UPI00331F3BB8
MEYSDTGEIEVGPAEHLTLQEFDLVNGALDSAAAAGQGEAVHDGVEVTAQTVGDRSQMWKGIGR